MKMLLGLQRLQPSLAGVGGAERYAHALLQYLPEHLTLRALITSRCSHLIEQYPHVEFSICEHHDFRACEADFNWCDCYYDSLNGLRPVHIPSRVPVICLIHDLQHMHYPMYFSDHMLESRVREYGYAIHRADLLLAISQFEANNFKRFYNAPWVEVVHSSGFLADNASEEADACAALELDFTAPHLPYLIFPGVPWHHKNHAKLLMAFALLQQRLEDPVGLVLTNNSPDNPNAMMLRRLARRLGIEHLVWFEEFLPEAVLEARMLNSLGMVFPSLYEGFGIPLVDAMKLGVPMLACRETAVPEICGEACLYFQSPRNAIAMAADLQTLVTDTPLRNRLVANAERQGARYSAETMAAGTARMAKRLVARHTMGHIPHKASIASHQAIHAAIQQTLHATRLAVTIVLKASDEAALTDGLLMKDSISKLYAPSFPKGTALAFVADMELCNNPALAQALESEQHVSLFDGTMADAVDATVHASTASLGGSTYHLLTTHANALQYTPVAIEEVLQALDLMPDREYVRFSGEETALIVVNPLHDVTAALAYAKEAASTFCSFDHIVRGTAFSAHGRQGSAQFASAMQNHLRPIIMPASLGPE